MAAHGQFHGIGDRVARGERRTHALMAHRDTVGHRNGGEFARCSAGELYAGLDGLRLPVERDVAGCGLVPARCHPDPGLVNLLITQTHRVEVAALRRPLGPFSHVTAGKTALVKTGSHAQMILGPLVVGSLRPPGCSARSSGIPRQACA